MNASPPGCPLAGESYARAALTYLAEPADLGDEQPYALWLRGTADLRFNCLRSVAVVGSRAATAYGSYVAAEFAAWVAARGWAVVSGGA